MMCVPLGDSCGNYQLRGYLKYGLSSTELNGKLLAPDRDQVRTVDR